jgi:hypothetical protein
MNKWFRVLALIFGLAFMALGIGFIALYIIEAIVKRAGEPDQSLLFWAIPILFMGIGGLLAGIFSVLWSLGKLGKPKK